MGKAQSALSQHSVLVCWSVCKYSDYSVHPQKPMQVPSKAHASTLKSPCKYPQKPMQVPSKAHASTLKSPCKYPQKPMQVPSKAHASTLKSPCKYPQKPPMQAPGGYLIYTLHYDILIYTLHYDARCHDSSV